MKNQSWMRAGGLLLCAWVPLSLALAGWDWTDRWTTPGRHAAYFAKLWLFWASAAAPLLLALLAGLVVGRGSTHRARWPAGLLLLPVALGTWARWIEPERVRVRHTAVAGAPPRAAPLRIALVADAHLGLFFRNHQLRRVVQRLNTLDVDAVFVAGDWTYEPPRDLAAAFAPLAQLRMPVFAVLGNHDTERPGPPLAAALRAALEVHGVQVVEGRRVDWRGWQVVGLDDLWGGQPLPQIARLAPADGAARIVLAHQPDTAQFLRPGAATLFLAGHSHGGQVWLPGITPRIIRRTMRTDWWDGLYARAPVPVFVTPGLGTVGLPVRLGVPPTIDVIELTN